MQPRPLGFVVALLVLATGCGAGSPASTSGDAGAPAADAASLPVVHADAAAEAAADACAGVVCDSPPPDACLGGVARTYVSQGTCTAGQCSYAHTDALCTAGCANGACQGADPCNGVACNTPPAASCTSATSVVTYGSSGTCSGGSCSYPSTTTSCSAQSVSVCQNGTLTTTVAGGPCAAGACASTSTTTTCPNGCEDGTTCRAHPQTFFVTRATYSPAFDPNQTGTPSGANDACVAAAAAAGLGGNFVAWIWDPTLNKPTTVQPGLPKPGPWYATDGTTALFPTPASLEGFPQAAITLDEYGKPVAAGETVWTGMGVGGQGGDSCCSWTAYCGTGSALALYGQTGTTAQAWIDAADGDCSGSTQRHLYCIEAD